MLVPDMRMEKTPGVLAVLVVSSLSPSQFWTVKTTAALFQYQSALISLSTLAD
jgi:hypothetical protein